jgi:hypothetical protein
MDVIVVGASGFGRELLQYVQDSHKSTPDVHIKGFRMMTWLEARFNR